MERTAILVTALIAVGLTALLGFYMIPLLRRLRYGQVIKEIGPTWHKNKEGTPTMGGLMIIIGTLVSVGVGYGTLVLEIPQLFGPQYTAEHVRFFAGIGAALLFAGIGFADDYLSIAHHQNQGLSAKHKLLLQFATAALYLAVMKQWGGMSTGFAIPFLFTIELGIYFYPVAAILIVGMVNAVNLTDGLDGLASTVTFFVSASFILISALLGYIASGLLSTAVAGATVGFILWNHYPAKVIMGDTGSLFLGGAVVVMAFGVDFPALILLSGIVYLLEAFSVMLQVGYFKLTKKLFSEGRRIFKMSPIHHHFELLGLSELQIVLMFSIITLIGCGLAVWSAMR